MPLRQGTQRLAHNAMLPHCLHQQINTPVVLADAEWLAAEQARLKGRFVASVRVIIICNVFLKPLLGFLRGNSLETRCRQPRVPPTRRSSHSSHPSPAPPATHPRGRDVSVASLTKGLLLTNSGTKLRGTTSTASMLTAGSSSRSRRFSTPTHPLALALQRPVHPPTHTQTVKAAASRQAMDDVETMAVHVNDMGADDSKEAEDGDGDEGHDLVTSFPPGWADPVQPVSVSPPPCSPPSPPNSPCNAAPLFSSSTASLGCRPRSQLTSQQHRLHALPGRRRPAR